MVTYYAGSAVREGGAWSLLLPDGAKIPVSYGKNKTPEERLASPDIDDVFAIPYATGPIAPVVIPDRDPGRVRLEAVLRAAYGATAKEVAAALVDVTLRGHTVRVHRKVREPFVRVAARLDEAARADPGIDRFFAHPGGTFNWRVIAGTERTSAHAWGIAIDLDTARAHYWRNDGATIAWKNSYPRAIVDAFEAEGFVWGGRWFHYDTMHFEYRPEILDPLCKAAAVPPD